MTEELTAKERAYLLDRAAVNGPDPHAERLAFCVVKLLRLYDAERARAEAADTLTEQQGREMKRLQQLVEMFRSSREAHAEGLQSAESRLAEATALLERVRTSDHSLAWQKRYAAFLYATPAQAAEPERE